MTSFKKKKLIGGKQAKCIICGINVMTNIDSTCGSPECKQKAHEKFHRMIQESSQDKYSKTRIGVFI